PLGPIMANSSLRPTVKLTPSMATTPAKASRTSSKERISSLVMRRLRDGMYAGGSRQPPLAAPVVLDLAEAADRPRGVQAAVEPPPLVVGERPERRRVEYQRPGLHHVSMRGNGRGHGRVLLDQQESRARPVDAEDQVADLLDQPGGQAQARL